MKAKIVKVWDDIKFGSVMFIVLQVEECDRALTSRNFDPGYKIIVQAIYHRVGAAGGHEFIPYYDTRVSEVSQKIDTVEADVLGFYLNSVKDIHDIPSELHTRDFWRVSRTARNAEDDDYETGPDSCYKLLLVNEHSLLEQTEWLYKALDNLDSHDILEGTPGRYSDMSAALRKSNEDMEKRLNIGEDEKRRRRKDIRLVYINKESLEELGSERTISSPECTIANYLWLPHEELPREKWEDFIGTHSFERVYCLSEEDSILDEI